jgi:hypothetical protein
LHHRFGHEQSRKTVYQAQIRTFEAYWLVSTWYFDKKIRDEKLNSFCLDLRLFRLCLRFFYLDLRDFTILGRQSKQKTVFCLDLRLFNLDFRFSLYLRGLEDFVFKVFAIIVKENSVLKTIKAIRYRAFYTYSIWCLI